MQIDKQQIISFLKSRGEQDKANQTDSELPQQVDTEKDSGLLAKFGIDPQDIIKTLGGKFGL